VLKAAKRWLHRDDDKVPASARHLAQALPPTRCWTRWCARTAPDVDEHQPLAPTRCCRRADKMVTMREELRQMWLNTSHSREHARVLVARPAGLVPCVHAELHQVERQFSFEAACRQFSTAWAAAAAPAALPPNYFSFVSLYSTCLRALGSNFMIDIFSGIVFLFLLVV
jgi:hypothetical protein